MVQVADRGASADGTCPLSLSALAGRRRPLALHGPRLVRPRLRQAQCQARQRCAPPTPDPALGTTQLTHGPLLPPRTSSSRCSLDTADDPAGQADGLNSRTLEIFENLGFIESIEKEGSRMVRLPVLPVGSRTQETDISLCRCRARSTSGTRTPKLAASSGPPKCARARAPSQQNAGRYSF